MYEGWLPGPLVWGNSILCIFAFVGTLLYKDALVLGLLTTQDYQSLPQWFGQQRMINPVRLRKAGTEHSMPNQNNGPAAAVEASIK